MCNSFMYSKNYKAGGKKMKDVSRGLLKVLKIVTEKEVKRMNEEWPPRCAGIFHQPKRPAIEHYRLKEKKV